MPLPETSHLNRLTNAWNAFTKGQECGKHPLSVRCGSAVFKELEEWEPDPKWVFTEGPENGIMFRHTRAYLDSTLPPDEFVLEFVCPSTQPAK
jgi:hypothetical protein